MNIISTISNLYFTGSLKPSRYQSTEKRITDYTKEEINDFETTEEAFNDSFENGHKFKTEALNFEADFNTLHGWMRTSGIGAVNSFFSGLGTYIGENLSFAYGVGLAGLSALASGIKNIPFLTKKHSFTNFGFGAVMRGPLHLLDSTFSLIGEKGAEKIFPSVFAGGLSIFSLLRVLSGNENKNLKVPFDTVGGTLGRMATHHMDSMLASKASHFSTTNQNMAAFLSSSITTLGFMLPEKFRNHDLPWDNFEGFIAQGSGSFIDSLSSNVGNAISTSSESNSKNALASLGFLASVPLLAKALNGWKKTINFPTIEGRLTLALFHAPESVVLNLGTVLGNSIWGLPISILCALGGGLTALTKTGGDFLKEKKISRNTFAGKYMRLPFEFLSAVSSQVGTNISKWIPAPLITLLGPALSFQIGEKLKGIDTKYDDLKGMVLRNSVHLWESVLSSASYRTGKMLTGNIESERAGSLLSDGRWLTSDGRIVSTMAMGKQLNECGEKSLTGILISLFSGFACALGIKHLYELSNLKNRADQSSVDFKLLENTSVHIVHEKLLTV